MSADSTERFPIALRVVGMSLGYGLAVLIAFGLIAFCVHAMLRSRVETYKKLCVGNLRMLEDSYRRSHECEQLRFQRIRHPGHGRRNAQVRQRRRYELAVRRDGKRRASQYRGQLGTGNPPVRLELPVDRVSRRDDLDGAMSVQKSVLP